MLQEAKQSVRRAVAVHPGPRFVKPGECLPFHGKVSRDVMMGALCETQLNQIALQCPELLAPRDLFLKWLLQLRSIFGLEVIASLEWWNQRRLNATVKLCPVQPGVSRPNRWQTALISTTPNPALHSCVLCIGVAMESFP